MVNKKKLIYISTCCFGITKHCVKGLYFPVFSQNTGKYGSEKNPYLDIFYAVTLVLDPCFSITKLVLVLFNSRNLEVRHLKHGKTYFY